MSSDQGGHQPAFQDVRSDRDAFSAGRDLTVNNYFSGWQSVSGKAPPTDGESVPCLTRGEVAADIAHLPWDFVVFDIPKSVQAGRASLRRWRDEVRSAAAEAWPGCSPLDIEVQIHVTFYHDGAPLDVDNMLKPIQDALCGVAYQDDQQLTDTHGHLRDLNGRYRVRGMTPAQAHGFTSGGPFVHIRIELPSSAEELP